MEIRTLSEMGYRLGVFACDNGKAILIQGSPLLVAKTKTGIVVIEDTEGNAEEIMRSLGYDLDEVKVFTTSTN